MARLPDLDDQPVWVFQARRGDVGDATQIEHDARDILARLGDANLLDQLVTNREHRHVFRSDHWVRSHEIEEDALRIAQVIAEDFKVPIGFDRDARHVRHGPEAHGRDPILSFRLGKRQTRAGHDQEAEPSKQRDTGMLSGEVRHMDS
jgi:hypothetical protein